jgi:hypothetical protein
MCCLRSALLHAVCFELKEMELKGLRSSLITNVFLPFSRSQPLLPSSLPCNSGRGFLWSSLTWLREGPPQEYSCPELLPIISSNKEINSQERRFKVPITLFFWVCYSETICMIRQPLLGMRFHFSHSHKLPFLFLETPIPFCLRHYISPSWASYFLCVSLHMHIIHLYTFSLINLLTTSLFHKFKSLNLQRVKKVPFSPTKY